MAMDILLKGSSVLDERRLGGNKEEAEDHQLGKEEDQLQCAKAKMVEAKEENDRLKMILSSIVKDYKTLQMHFFDIVQQKESTAAATATATSSSYNDSEETELVSLSLGTNNSTSANKKSEKVNCMWNKENGDDHLKEELSIGLGTKLEPNDRNLMKCYEESKAEDAIVVPNKMSKTCRGAEDDESKETHTKRARVSVRARCDAPTMQDGCQWRKYGQKISKGNPCPRAYYRCTVAPSCPVRKQVQRCAEDMSILITTYEGTHNHPLTIQATAMASTTSAAACMLMSGSSALSDAATSIAAGLTFDTSRNSITRPFYITNPSFGSSSACPTITLDLANTSSTPKFSTSPSPFPPLPKYSPSMGFANFGFGFNQNNLPASGGASIGLANSGYFNNGLVDQFNKSPIVSSCLARPSHEGAYQTYLQKPNPLSSAPVMTSSQQNFSETIAAATMAITSDPSFRSALATAIKSIVGSNTDKFAARNVAENVLQSGLKWGHAQFPSSKDGYS